MIKRSKKPAVGGLSEDQNERYNESGITGEDEIDVAEDKKLGDEDDEDDEFALDEKEEEEDELGEEEENY